MTRWAAQVDPACPLPEYPRPQLVRRAWTNLNGLWNYAIDPGARLADASGNGHDGRVFGEPAWRAHDGPSGGGAYAFDGKDDGISLPVLARGDMTLAIWVRTTQRGGGGAWYGGVGLFDGECAGVTDDFGAVLSEDTFAFGVGNPDTTIHAKTAINDGHWHHLAATRSAAAGEIRVYVDGKLEAQGKAGTQKLAAPSRLTLGQLQTNINAFRGSLADARAYDRVLSDAEVAAAFAARAAGDAGPAPSGWWRLDRDWQGGDRTITFDGKILVPFPLESALSGVAKPLLPKQKLYYRRSFSVPATDAGARLLLHFGAVDHDATVLVNGTTVGTHSGGYDPFSFDITDAVQRGSNNELSVVVTDNTGGNGEPKGKQNLGSMARPGGIMYTPCSGIWQTVWLEPVPRHYIESLKIIPDVDAGAVRVRALAAGGGAGSAIDIRVSDGPVTVAAASGKPGETISIPIAAPKLWSPDSPFLYDLTVSLKTTGGAVDTVKSYFGMRKIAIGKDPDGITRILLNNHFVFQMGFLDQGFWPDGIYTAPTDEALRYDIEASKRLGMNMARKHVKIEPARWYAWCDRLGLLVWQDMPSAGAGTGGTGQKPGTPASPERAAQFETELKAMVESFGNHPCIVTWVVFNEGWGQYDTARLVPWVKSLDPTRLVSNASGWHDRKVGDLVDVHSYPGPAAPRWEPNRAAVLGEFGGLGLATEGHTWVERTWGYRNLSGPRALTRRYCDLMRRLWARRDEGLSAAVYTQTTDIETECNGLITYDRAVIKVDLEAVSAANRGHVPPPPSFVTLVPTSRAVPATWRYTLAAPPEGWEKPSFDDGVWQPAPPGFGAGILQDTIRTEWRTADIWLRRTFSLDRVPAGEIALRICHDDRAEVYLNGVLAATLPGATGEYEDVEISEAAQRALKVGVNTLAVHCHQDRGGQFIDVGLSRLVPPTKP